MWQTEGFLRRAGTDSQFWGTPIGRDARIRRKITSTKVNAEETSRVRAVAGNLRDAGATNPGGSR